MVVNRNSRGNFAKNVRVAVAGSIAMQKLEVFVRGRGLSCWGQQGEPQPTKGKGFISGRPKKCQRDLIMWENELTPARRLATYKFQPGPTGEAGEALKPCAIDRDVD